MDDYLIDQERWDNDRDDLLERAGMKGLSVHIPMNMTTHSGAKWPPDPGNPGSL
jgi:hypothetical protein